MSTTIEEISAAVEKGKAKLIKELVPKAIEEGCGKLGIPLYETEGANHSLETGDVEKDIKELRKVMKIVRDFVGDRKV